ncbi:MAG: hypothetical protein ACTSWX_01250 [Promethearchaeota archaeon]
MGERAKSIGEEAETKVWNFLTSLGYDTEETNNEDYNIDCIAVSPDKIPKYGLANPNFSPGGLVAFEVKEPKVTKKKIEKFKEKIDKYNRYEAEKLEGGIYIVDKNVSEKMNKHSIDKDIYCWGIKRQRLYVEKIKIFNECKINGFNIIERIVDDTNSYLLCVITPPTDYQYLIKLYLFYDDPYHKYTPKKMDDVLTQIKEKTLNPLLELGIKPINLFFESHSNGGISKGLKIRITKISDLWKEEGILIYIGDYIFRDYRAFPTL